MPVHITCWPASQLCSQPRRVPSGGHATPQVYHQETRVRAEQLISTASPLPFHNPVPLASPPRPPERHEPLSRPDVKKVLNHTQGPIGSYKHILFPSDFLLTNTKGKANMKDGTVNEPSSVDMGPPAATNNVCDLKKFIYKFGASILPSVK